MLQAEAAAEAAAVAHVGGDPAETPANRLAFANDAACFQASARRRARGLSPKRSRDGNLRPTTPTTQRSARSCAAAHRAILPMQKPIDEDLLLLALAPADSWASRPVIHRQWRTLKNEAPPTAPPPAADGAAASSAVTDDNEAFESGDRHIGMASFTRSG